MLKFEIYLNADSIIFIENIYLCSVFNLNFIVMSENFDFSKYVAGVVYLTENPLHNYVMSVYSNLEAASNSYEVLQLGFNVRPVHLLTSAI